MENDMVKRLLIKDTEQTIKDYTELYEKYKAALKHIELLKRDRDVLMLMVKISIEGLENVKNCLTLWGERISEVNTNYEDNEKPGTDDPGARPNP